MSLKNIVLPTASNVSVYLNGYHVDLAYRIDYKEDTGKVPIYGYNDLTYSSIAATRSIVQGILVVNFAFPGYLQFAIQAGTRRNAEETFNVSGEISEQSTVKIRRDVLQSLKNELPPNFTEEDRVARAQYIASLLENKDTAKETTRILKILYGSDKKNVGSSTRQESALVVDGRKRTGSTLDVYFEDQGTSTWLMRFSDVYFTDVSQQASQAGAEGSAEPLYEIYSFIASSRNTILLNR